MGFLVCLLVFLALLLAAVAWQCARLHRALREMCGMNVRLVRENLQLKAGIDSEQRAAIEGGMMIDQAAWEKERGERDKEP